MQRRHLLLAALGFALAPPVPAAADDLKPWTGGATPPLKLPGLDGKPVSLADYRGKVVLVNFWATWCEPCLKEMPSMKQLRAELKGKPFEILAVNLGESEGRIRRFLEQLPLDFPVLMDSDKSVTKAWGARILPASFLVGRDGKIRYRVVGDIDWTGAPARKAVDALLK